MRQRSFYTLVVLFIFLFVAGVTVALIHPANSKDPIPPRTDYFFQAVDPSGSWNPHVSCNSPWIVRISDITNNMTGTNSLNNSRFSPGITESVPGSEGAKRWLTAGATPPGWVPPGPACSITNSKGQVVASFVEIDGVATGGMSWETDCSTSYDSVNGGGAQPSGHWCDHTVNIWDPAIFAAAGYTYATGCRGTSPDPSCYGKMHLEFDHDWMAAGYCGIFTSYCNNSTLAQNVNPGSPSTLFDFQGFVFWDPLHVTEQQHSFSGWELHALTAWRPHYFTITASPSSLTVARGSAASSTVTIAPLSGFTGTVSLAVSSTPPGLTCSMNPTSVTLGPVQTSTVSCSGSAGVYAVSVAGTATAPSGVVSYSTKVTVTVTDFTIGATPTTVTVNAGVAGTSTMTLAPMNGFTGTVALTSMISPSTGLTCTLTPASITLGASQNSILSCNGSANTYTVTVTGMNGSLSHSATVIYTIVDFTVSPNLTAVTTNAGTAATSTITVAPMNGFKGTVTLAVTTNSTSLVCSLASTSITGGSGTSTLSCTGSPAGNYLATVTGTSGTLSHAATVVYHVQDFTVTANPTSVTVSVGVTSNSTITVAPLNGFVGTVALGVTTNSTNLVCTLTSTSITGGSGMSTLSCHGSPAGNYLATVTGTSGTLSHSATVTYHVQDFTNSAGPTIVNVNAGVAGTSTIMVSAVNGFAGTVTLVMTTNSTNLSCTLTSTSIIGGSGTSTLSCTSSVAGNYLATVTGYSGTLSHPATVTFHVQDFTASASPTSVTDNASVTTTSIITIAPLNGFAGALTLQVTTNSTSLVCTLSPTSLSGGSGTSNLSCHGSPAGNYLATVTGSSGSLSHYATVTYTIQDFTIIANPTSVGVNVNQTGTSTITIAAVNGFTGVVGLSANNAGCTLTPTSVIGSGTSTISCRFASPGTVVVTVTGTSGTISHTVSVTVTIRDFAVSSSPTSVTVLAGTVANSTLTVAPLNGFTGTVTLAATTNSANLSCTLSPTTITGGSGTSTLSCTGSAAGNYLATVSGTSGSLSHSATVTYHVEDFTIAANPTSVTANAGAVGTSTATVSPVNSLPYTVTLAVTTNSTNLSCTLNSTSITGGSGTSTLSCTGSPAANYLATVTGTSGTLSHAATVTYNVQDFTVSASPTNVTVNASVTATSTITVAPVNRLAGRVTLAVTINSTNLVCTLSVISITGGSGNSTLSCHGSPAGNYLATVTGTNGTLSHPATVAYHVQDFTISANPTSDAVNAGVAGTSTITVAPVNGFAGTVALAVTTNSTNVFCTLTSISITGGSGISTLSCTSSVTGNYLATVTGTSGTLSHAVTVAYHVQDFAVTASPISVTVNGGVTATSTITVAPVNGFAGTVTLTVASNSTNLVCSLSSTSIAGGSGTQTLSCHGYPASNYNAAITGTNGTLSHISNVVFHVQDFTMSASPAIITVNASVAGTSRVTVSPLNGFAGTISLAVTTNSTNLSCSLTSTSIAGGLGTSTLSCTGSVAGNYLATVTGTNGTLSHSATVTYHVQDFTVTAITTRVSVTVNVAGNATITVEPVNGFTGTVTLAVTTNSTSLSCTLSSTSITGGSGTSTLSCSSGIAANYLANVTGTSGTLSHTVIVNMTVQDFSLSGSPSQVTILAGQTGNSTITVTSLNHFAGNVSLAVFIVPASGLSCGIAPSILFVGYGTATLSCSGLAGSYNVTVTGTSGSTSNSTKVSYSVGQDSSVGGTIMPIDKLGLALPILEQSLILTMLSISAVVLFRRVRKNQS